MGYSGGDKADPSYSDLGDHTETLQIDYDPSKVSYEDLLDVFWNTHDPTEPSLSRQYMNAVFYHNDEQERLAKQSRDRKAHAVGRRIFTKVLRAKTFTMAEDYHQKYALRRDRDLMREFIVIYPNFKDFVNSTAVARANGYLSGYGSLIALEEELPGMGLSEEAGKKLYDRVKRREAKSGRF